MKLTQDFHARWSESVERQLKSAFYLIIFEPLIPILREATAQFDGLVAANSAGEAALRSALRSGKIQYSKGTFSGMVSVETGRTLRALGATFNPRLMTYRIAEAEVPAWVKHEALAYTEKAAGVHKALEVVLGHIESALEQLVDKHAVDAKETVAQVVGSFVPMAKALEIKPELSEKSEEELSKNYSENMKIYVEEFSREQITSLRQTVRKNAEEGYRFDRLIQRIENRYDISKRKAAFLAEQETRLFLSEYRRQRFGEAGVEEYIWRTSHDARVRHDHKRLDGKRFRYDSPPVSNLETQARNNPGQDFGCRCNDEPVVANLKRLARAVA